MSDQSSKYNAIVDNFVLTFPEARVRHLAVGWLFLALSALVIGGIFSVLIVLSRTPYFQDVIPWSDFFHSALVVHVDMTVLVWFLCFAGVLWTLNSSQRCLSCSWFALLLCAAGTLIMAIAPFLGAGSPLMNNYIPVLRHPLFMTGLGLFGLGFAFLVIKGLIFSQTIGSTISGEGSLRFGLYTGLIAAFVTLLVFSLTYIGMPDIVTGTYFYELLFWGSGHTVQYVHIQLMLVCWLWIATIAGIQLSLSPRIALLIFAIGLLPVIVTPLVYVLFDPGTQQHKQAFTMLMQYGGGLAALPVGLIIVFGFTAINRGRVKITPEFNALAFSIMLFAVGGIIGFTISDSSVTVPAHYHGSIVAVTLAYMGLTFHLMPGLGFRPVSGKAANWQPVIYGSGQLLHIIGLLLSGGYGVQRKTAGAAQGLDDIERIVGMGIMGLGGLIAVIGGFMFLILVFRAMWPQRERTG